MGDGGSHWSNLFCFLSSRMNFGNYRQIGSLYFCALSVICRTGFEENKDFPILLNTIVAERYYVTEYLGSAAFSKVVQAHDIQTGVDVCLKIIKNDKDFFDQSLDEIKLLKYVNKHDPADAHHILRLYDYFYYQVCYLVLVIRFLDTQFSFPHCHHGT